MDMPADGPKPVGYQKHQRFLELLGLAACAAVRRAAPVHQCTNAPMHNHSASMPPPAPVCCLGVLCYQQTTAGRVEAGILAPLHERSGSIHGRLQSLHGQNGQLVAVPVWPVAAGVPWGG